MRLWKSFLLFPLCPLLTPQDVLHQVLVFLPTFPRGISVCTLTHPSQHVSTGSRILKMHQVCNMSFVWMIFASRVKWTHSSFLYLQFLFPLFLLLLLALLLHLLLISFLSVHICIFALWDDVVDLLQLL